MSNRKDRGEVCYSKYCKVQLEDCIEECSWPGCYIVTCSKHKLEVIPDIDRVYCFRHQHYPRKTVTPPIKDIESEDSEEEYESEEDEGVFSVGSLSLETKYILNKDGIYIQSNSYSRSSNNSSVSPTLSISNSNSNGCINCPHCDQRINLDIRK